MRTQAEPRVKKRIPCEFTFGGERHTGIVLNMSRSGIYVQTGVVPAEGDDVALDLAPITESPLFLRATVVWKRVVSRRVQGDHGGMGLQIQAASDTWYDFLDELLPAVKTEDVEPAGRNLSDPGSPRFRARVRFGEQPRTRTLVVAAEDEDQARARALEEAGAGWELLELEPLRHRAPTD